MPLSILFITQFSYMTFQDELNSIAAEQEQDCGLIEQTTADALRVMDAQAAGLNEDFGEIDKGLLALEGDMADENSIEESVGN